MRCVVYYTGSSNTIILKPGSDTKVQASNAIVFEPGFSTESGALLDATISPMPLNNTTVRLASLTTTPIDHSQKNPYADVVHDFSLENPASDKAPDADMVYDFTAGNPIPNKTPAPKLQAYPNPAEGGWVYLSIQNYEIEEQVNYEVYNASGRLVSTFEASTMEQLRIEPTHWPSGVYVVRVTGSQWTVVERFVKL